MIGTQLLEPFVSCCLLQCVLAGSWSQTEPRLKPRCSDTGCKCPSWWLLCPPFPILPYSQAFSLPVPALIGSVKSCSGLKLTQGQSPCLTIWLSCAHHHTYTDADIPFPVHRERIRADVSKKRKGSGTVVPVCRIYLFSATLSTRRKGHPV